MGYNPTTRCFHFQCILLQLNNPTLKIILRRKPKECVYEQVFFDFGTDVDDGLCGGW